MSHLLGKDVSAHGVTAGREEGVPQDAGPGQLPGLLPVQAPPGQRRRGSGPRLPRRNGSTRDKGLLITTGTFTADAKKEATRDGALPIDLIDGDRLCELLRRYDLGVRTTTWTVEDASIDGAFFGEI